MPVVEFFAYLSYIRFDNRRKDAEIRKIQKRR